MGLGTCRLNLAQLFVSHVCKESQVHIHLKNFVHDHWLKFLELEQIDGKMLVNKVSEKG